MKLLIPMAVLLFLAAGCKPTEIKFENQVPDARVENIRWDVESDRCSYLCIYDVGGALGPGESSETIGVYWEDENRTGTVRFELVVEGSRVALVSKQKLKAGRAKTTTFTFKPEMEVTNPLLEE